MTSPSLDLFGQTILAGKKWGKSKCPFLSLLVVLAVSGCSAMEKNVPQTPATDTVVVIAEDFFADSAYSVSVQFQACCTDAIECKNMGFGFRLDSMLFVLTPKSKSVSIPLQYSREAKCPYRFNMIFIGNVDVHKWHGYFTFVKDPKVKANPASIDLACLSLPFSEAQEREDCRGSLQFNLPSNNDTITLRRRVK